MGRVYRYESKKLRNLTGVCPSLTLAVNLYEVSESFAFYWRKKFVDKNFHPLSHGGIRWLKFSPKDHEEIREFIWEQIKKNPTSR